MPRPRRTNSRLGSARSGRPSNARLRELIEEATVDAYGDAEQISGLFTMIDEHLRVPFETQVLGIKVVVERVDLNEADEIVAVCRAGRRRHRIPILDLPLPTPAPEGAERVAAYRHWLGA
jgi:hypothetical protein